MFIEDMEPAGPGGDAVAATFPLDYDIATLGVFLAGFAPGPGHQSVSCTRRAVSWPSW